MAPAVTSNTAADRSYKSKFDQRDGTSSLSRRPDSICGSRSNQSRVISSREKIQVSKPTLTASSIKSSDIKSHTKIQSTSDFPLPSTRLNKHKQAVVFNLGKRKHKTIFSSSYDSGLIPCRINHGSIRNSLLWTTDPKTLSYDPLLITCIKGFLETEHPFVFLSRAAFCDLMVLENAYNKTVPILAQVIVPLREALMAKDDDTFLMALKATRLLSNLVKSEMNMHLSKLTQQIHRKLLANNFRAEVGETLAVLESNGGKEALAIICSKIPTYTSIR
ncbi:Uncharacterized conserved protein [Plasmopara halstedii]|uniref:Uncharacterized conserved protein n=1 Tax=Plasmopara halstedii TaxID=4781 RepID=A0A0P1AX49_PLAHL|nr:Uncharacterized conserved protein [Plasmopara halstedii]CEG46986.1 Uncharacterized conserved protein [Plasmopara halstedii]|eukprot:XP_024583355.1 Uncharacterized conserved protein [Plasmopara halstedii]